MEFRDQTVYNRRTLAAMARALRKTICAKSARRRQIFCWFVIAICLLDIYGTWGNPRSVAIDTLALLLLLTAVGFQDSVSAFFARRRALPGLDSSETVFRPDCFEVKICDTVTQWQYHKILALAETGSYLILVLGKNHAIALEKATLEGGTLEEFRRFLEERTCKQLQNIGG